MKRIILGQEIQFHLYQDKGIYCKIPLADGEHLFNIPADCVYYGRQPAPEMDWECIDAFIAYYLTNYRTLQAQARKKLTRLMLKIGWWREYEMAASTFTLSYVTPIQIRTQTFLGKTHKFKDRFTFEMGYHYESEQFWVDVYGLWLISFKNHSCLGAVRKQI
jgi:hypothetical protein